jgi:choice-of-anchor B domain-containing protein
MGKYFLLVLVFSFGTVWGQNAENIEEVYHYDDPNLPAKPGGQKYSDCWGYIGPNGEEVAIIGTLDSILFFDITDVNSVQKLVGVGLGGNSSWRDFKTYENYCYGVADQWGTAQGLTIINMDSILAGTATFRQETTDFGRCHNIWIDTATAKLYTAAADNESQGLIIYDLSVDPYHPTVWSRYDLKDYGVSCASSYVHDLYVRNDTAYCNVNSCGYYVLDVSDSLPSVIGSLQGSAFASGYNHSGWVADDGSFAVVAEETHENPLHFVDLADISDMGILSTYKDPVLHPSQTDNIVHNPFIRGNLCFVAYYHDGLQVLDVSNPADPVRVGYFLTNTSLPNYTGNKGAWGTYPFFPSGHVIVSDVSEGLYVLELDQSILAADWLTFETEYWDERSFYLNVEFQTTYALDQAVLQWSMDGLEFQDWTTLDVNHWLHLNYSWSGELNRPTDDGFFVRLRTEEKDGDISFSPIRRLRAIPNQSAQLYPNPAESQLTIRSEMPGTFELVGISGRLVLRSPIGVGPQTIQLPSQLSGSTYWAIWRDENGQILHRNSLVVK